MEISDRHHHKLKKQNTDFSFVDLLTKKKKKNWNEKFPKKNDSIPIPNLSDEDLTNVIMQKSFGEMVRIGFVIPSKFLKKIFLRMNLK